MHCIGVRVFQVLWKHKYKHFSLAGVWKWDFNEDQSNDDSSIETDDDSGSENDQNCDHQSIMLEHNVML